MGALNEIVRLATKSYADAWALASRGTPALFIALLILAAGDVAGILVARIFTTELGKTLAGTLCAIGALWFAAPYVVSLFRLLLADRVNPNLETFNVRQANARLFAWSSVFAFAAALPEFTFALVPPGLTPESIDAPGAIGLMWITFLLLVLLWIVTARTVTLLPATALGRDVGLVQAFNHTRGRFWFVMGAAFLPILPVLVVGRLLIGGTEGVTLLALSLVLSLLMEALALVVSANLYRWLMDHRS